MISFGHELLGGRGFSLILLKGLHAIISADPRLLLPTKSVVLYVGKHNRSIIFEWHEKEKGWYLYIGEFPLGWEKKVKVVNLLAPTKKVSMSRTAKLKSAKKGDDSSKTYSDIIPYKGGLPSISNIVLESFPPLFASTTAAQGAPAETPILPSKPISAEEST